jgi:hypothetical protein
MLTQLTLSQVKKKEKSNLLNCLWYLVCPMWLHMFTSVDHPSALDLNNVNATFSQSAKKDGDIPSVSEIFCLRRIIIHLFNRI